MKELKLIIEDVTAFEGRLVRLGGKMETPRRIANWYLETAEDRLLKISDADGTYTLMELRKRDAGFEFVRAEPVADIESYRLGEVPEHDVLHKIERRWTVKGRSIDVLIFPDIGDFACIYYEDGTEAEAQAFIRDKLELAGPHYLEVPFNILKRRRLGMADFGGL